MAVVDCIFMLVSWHLCLGLVWVLISGFVFVEWVFCSLVSVSSLEI